MPARDIGGQGLIDLQKKVKIPRLITCGPFIDNRPDTFETLEIKDLSEIGLETSLLESDSWSYVTYM